MIAIDQDLGWIGIAPRSVRQPGDWIPADAAAVLVPRPTHDVPTGTMLSAIDTAGTLAHVSARTATKVLYGCEQNQLDVLAFTGVSLVPGPVWLLPPTAPASWRPTSLEIVSPVSATEAYRHDTVGPLSLEFVRSAPTRGQLTISRDGRVLYSAAVLREAMAGASAEPLDLRKPGVSVPVPIAAWSIVHDGPILLVLLVPSYEGTHLTAVLVEPGRARDVPAMATYMYRCAF